MQTLGIADSGMQSENRLKRLFWPSVRTATDVDDLATQGYWVCAIVAVLSFVFSVLTGHPVAGILILLYYYMGGVGVREHSLYAAAAVLIMYGADLLISPSILKVLLTALLLSNLRATWMASKWKPDSAEAEMPVRLNETWGDKFVDALPRRLWPIVRIPYYVFSGCFFAVVLFGILTLFRQRF